MSDTILAPVTITLEPRSDGGLRIYSDELSGLLLSHRDPALVIGDLLPAIRTLQESNGTDSEGIVQQPREADALLIGIYKAINALTLMTIPRDMVGAYRGADGKFIDFEMNDWMKRAEAYLELAAPSDQKE